jgi:RND family efflux transporter MFP subunit
MTPMWQMIVERLPGRCVTAGARRSVGVAAVAGLLCCGLAGCEETEFAPPPPPEVGVAAPIVRDVTRTTDLSGRTEAVQVVEVRARVEGILLESLASPGSRVEEGTVLFRIDPDRFVAERDGAAARLERAEAELGIAEVRLDRVTRAAEMEAVNRIEVLEAQATVDAAKADVEIAKRELETKQLSLDYTEVRAPLTGEIEAGAPDIGSLVGGLGSGPLTRIYDTSSVYVWLTVPDRLFLQTPAGMREAGETIAYPIEVATEADEGYPHSGTIDYVDPAVDTRTGTVRLRATVPNPEGALKPGLFVRCRVVAGRIEDALLVPETAINSGQIGRYVLVVGNDGLVETRQVTRGPRDGSMRVVESGLVAGDRVIVRGLLRARPGRPVRAVEERVEDTGGNGRLDASVTTGGDAAGPEMETR